MAEQHLMYHWRHGWIPLTHAAALSKAKGNAKLADKYVPGASSHHGDMHTAGSSARAIHATLTPHERHHSDATEVAKLRNGDHATVHGMDEYGQPMSFTGRVSGVPTAVRIKQGRNGKAEHHFAVSMHNGSEGSNGLDATARTTVYVKNPDHLSATATTEMQRRMPSRGDAPATAVGALFDRSRMTPAQEREHVRNVQGQLDAARAARANPADDAASKTDAELEVMAKRSPLPAYREAAKAEMARRQSTSTGSTPDASKRVQVDHSGDGTTLEIDRTDTQAREAVKAAGFRWSSNLGAWYLPRTYSEPTRRQKVEDVKRTLGEHNVHVNDGGRGATTTAAEREAATRAVAADRAERMDARAQRAATEADVRFGRARAIGDMIPMGQPILVGHHSEGRHRRDLAKIDSNMRKGVEAQNESAAAAHAADNARRTAAGDSPLMRQRRIDRNEAEVRKIDRQLQEHRIATKAPQQAARVGIHPLSADYHDQLTAQRAQLTDQIAHDKAQIEASGHKEVDLKAVKMGDLVVDSRGRGHVVSKVNQKTVSVPSSLVAGWEDKVAGNQITKHVPMSELSDAALKSAASLAKGHPKLLATYVRELNRRGIHLGNAS